MENWVPVATRIVHFTGYEIKLDMIQLADPARSQARAPARHRGFDRANGGSLLSREVPRPALSGIRARRNRRRDRHRRRAAGPLQLGVGSTAPDSGVRARNLRGSASKASSNTPTATSKLCSAARIPISRPSTAIWVILHRVLRTERWPMLRRNPPLFTSGDKQIRSGARPDAGSPEGSLGLSAQPALRQIDRRDVARVQLLEARKHDAPFPAAAPPRWPSCNTCGAQAPSRLFGDRRKTEMPGFRLHAGDARPERGERIRTAAACASSHSSSRAKGPPGANSSRRQLDPIPRRARARDRRDQDPCPSDAGWRRAAPTTAKSRRCAPAALSVAASSGRPAASSIGLSPLNLPFQIVSCRSEIAKTAHGRKIDSVGQRRRGASSERARPRARAAAQSRLRQRRRCA